MRERINTIQKRNNLNDVYRDGEVGPGGAYHKYHVIPIDLPIAMTILFQNGARNDRNAQHGALDVDLLEIVRDRLTCFQSGEYACRENACALTHIEEALMWMNKRVEDRAERHVLGTYEK